jgi:hypothetical protein
MTQKAFASVADLEEKPVSFVQLSDHGWAFISEGDPNTGCLRNGQVVRNALRHETDPRWVRPYCGATESLPLSLAARGNQPKL